MTLNSLATLRVYHLSRREFFSYLVWIAFVLLFFSLPNIVQDEYPFSWAQELVLLLFALPVVLFIVYIAWCTRLTVGPAGIEYRALTHRIFARWEDVTAWIETPGYDRTSGLYLRAATLQVRWWAKPWRSNYIFDDYLPLSCFADPLAGNALGQQLQHYIPHVLAPGTRRKRKPK